MADLVGANSASVGAGGVGREGERRVRVLLVHVDVAPVGGVPGVSDAGTFVRRAELVFLSERCPQLVARRKEGLVRDHVAGFGALERAAGAGVHLAERLSAMERLGEALRVAASGCGGSHRRPDDQRGGTQAGKCPSRPPVSPRADGGAAPPGARVLTAPRRKIGQECACGIPSW